MTDTPKKPRAKSKYMLLHFDIEDKVFMQTGEDYESIQAAINARDEMAKDDGGGHYRIVTIRSDKTATQQTDIKWN